MSCILLGPSVALTGEGSSAGGYADKFNMWSITIPTIAFAAAAVRQNPPLRQSLTNISLQARHALTTDSKFLWSSANDRGFSYLTFYYAIIKRVSEWSQMERTQLISWWNGCVLSILCTNGPFPISHTPSPSFHLTAGFWHASEGVLDWHPHRTIPSLGLLLHSCISSNRKVKRPRRR